MLKIFTKNTGFSPKKQGFNNVPPHNESGSIIIWIFLMIALFAALNFALSSGSRSGGAKISKEQARIAATEILDYTNTIKNAVRTLQINGCADTEVSFDQAVVAGYSNTNSPSDESCHVFKPNGGGLNYRAPETEWLDSSKSALNFYGTLYTTSKLYITGLGTDGTGSNCSGTTGDCRELITGIPFIRKEVCMAINKKLGWGTDSQGTPFKDTGNSYGASTHATFTGAYTLTGNRMGVATPSNYSNIMMGCIEGDTDPASGSYSFFQVLIVR